MTLVGINTLVYMQELQAGVPQSQLLPRIAKLGATFAEVRREYIANEAERLAIKEAAQQAGLELYLSIPQSLIVEGTVHPELNRYLQEAQQMGARHIKFNQGTLPTADADVIANIDQRAAAASMTLTIENDQTELNGTFACTSASLQRLQETGSAIGYTFDLGNWLWRNEDPQAAFAALQQRITVFHLKNVAGTFAGQDLHTTLLAEGDIDWKPMVQSLDSSVPVFLEYPIDAEHVAQEFAAVQAAREQ